MNNRVYKYIVAVAMLLMVALIFVGCTNRTIFDTTWKFGRAVVDLHNGEFVEGLVDSWKDFENSDMMQVTINGVTYLTHSANVILIAE